MKCPKCASVMIEETRRGIATDRCSGCGGYWFDRVALAHCIAASPSQLDRQNLADSVFVLEGQRSVHRCPSCGDKRLRKDEFGPTDLEYCRRCFGVFVTPEALDVLIKAQRSKRRRETRETLAELGVETAKFALAAVIGDFLGGSASR